MSPELVMAGAARWERRIISERTRDALKSRRRAGVKLGRPASVSPQVVALIVEKRKHGASYNAIAQALNQAGVPTPRTGREWYASTVRAIWESRGSSTDEA